MITKEHLKTLISRKDELYKFLNIPEKTENANTLESITQEPEFWGDPKKAQIIITFSFLLRSFSV